jgi:predicted neuraminidase
MKTGARLICGKWLAGAVGLSLSGALLAGGLGAEAIVNAEFISEMPGVPSVHASTITESTNGLVAAWFGGTEEGALDVSIWMTRQEGGAWLPPFEVANGRDLKKHRRYPCWNPVLFTRRNGEMLLFYHVGPNPRSWWCLLKRSLDGGVTWSKARRLPRGYLGPIKNPPIELANGTLLCGSSTEDAGWRVHLEWATDPFGNWFKSKPLNRSFAMPAIQPTLIPYGEQRIQLLCRTKVGCIAESWSADGGVTWSRLKRTILPNPNSGIDAVRLFDGRALLAYNHTPRGRGMLNLATSPDGETWEAAAVLENEPGAEFSYPTIIQTSDGLVHLTYTWKREKIKHVVINPARLRGGIVLKRGPWPAP